ncbi:MAG: xylose isomerase [Hyphomicrobiales bacterium]
MIKEFFPDVGSIQYKGSDSNDLYSFKWYDKDKTFGDYSLGDFLQFSISYWNSFGNKGNDFYGSSTKVYPWLLINDSVKSAHLKADAAFELMSKLNIDYYSFHDFDLINEGTDLTDSEIKLQIISDYIKEKQDLTHIQPLWASANLYTNPRYMNGAVTNPDFGAVAYAGAQVQNALDIAIKLNAKNYVFWGGREGYSSILNTNNSIEKSNTAKFLKYCRDYARKNGFEGNLVIEPSAHTPCRHQYAADVKTVIGFLLKNKLEKDFKIIVNSHKAFLAGHALSDEIQAALECDMLSGINANRGNEFDDLHTELFPIDLIEATKTMLILLRNNSIHNRGVNFEASTVRNSTDLNDIIIAHIMSMDTYARAAIAAHKIYNNSKFKEWINFRYRTFKSGIGLDFSKGKLSLEDLKDYALEHGEPNQISSKQELYEQLIISHL